MPVSVSQGTTPGPPQQSIPRLDVSQLVAILQANKERKRQGELDKRTQAQQNLAFMMELNQLGTAIDPKEFEKQMKIGYPEVDLGTSGASPVDLPPQQGAALGGTMQGVKEGGQTGAAAAGTTSRSAAAKAPGEGVTKPAIPGTGQGSLQSMLSERSNLGQLNMANQTAGAQQQAIMFDLFKRASGDPKQNVKPDPVAAMHFTMMNKIQDPKVPIEDIMGSIYLSGTPEQQTEIAAGLSRYNAIQETPKRKAEILKSITSTNGYDGVIPPSQWESVATSLAEGKGIPAGVQLNPSLSQIAEVNKLTNNLVVEGVPAQLANSLAYQSVLTGSSLASVAPQGWEWGPNLSAYRARTTRATAETSQGELELREAKARQDTVPEGTPGIPSFLYGVRWDQATQFMDLSEKIKNTPLESLKNSIIAIANSVKDPDSNEELQVMIKLFQERVVETLGTTFQFDTPTGEARWWWWNSVILKGPSTEKAISGFAGSAQSLPGLLTVKPPIKEEVSEGNIQRTREFIKNMQDLRRSNR